MKCQWCPAVDKCIGEQNIEICQDAKNGNKKILDDIFRYSLSLSFAGKVKTFGKAVVRHTIDGFRNVSLEVKQERLNVCQQCENMTENRDCRLCGCQLDIKTSWASEKCPIDLWPAIIEINRKFQPCGTCGDSS